MKDTGQATADYVRSWELDSTSFDNRWMVEWAMCQRKPDLAMAERLEQIASVDLQNVRAYVCRGVALWLRGNLELSLTELEQAIAVEPEGWDGYFWKGMTCASLGRGEEARAAIEKSLEAGLPPVLLAPLRWFEQERPEFYEKYAAPVLARYDL